MERKTTFSINQFPTLRTANFVFSVWHTAIAYFFAFSNYRTMRRHMGNPLSFCFFDSLQICHVGLTIALRARQSGLLPIS